MIDYDYNIILWCNNIYIYNLIIYIKIKIGGNIWNFKKWHVKKWEIKLIFLILTYQNSKT